MTKRDASIYMLSYLGVAFNKKTDTVTLLESYGYTWNIAREMWQKTK